MVVETEFENDLLVSRMTTESLSNLLELELSLQEAGHRVAVDVHRDDL